MSSPSPPPTMSADSSVDDPSASSSSSGKGKAVSRPMAIHHLPPLDFTQHDTFDFAASVSSDLMSSAGPSSVSSTRFGISVEEDVFMEDIGKGKQKADLDPSPPSLPPLTFMEVDQDISWSTLLHSSPDGSVPSSSYEESAQIYGSPVDELDPSPTPVVNDTAPGTQRRNSYPDVAPTTRSLKSRLTGPSGTLARRLLLRKRNKSLAITAIVDDDYLKTSPPLPTTTSLDTAAHGHSLVPWLHERAYSDSFSVISGIEVGVAPTPAIQALQRSQTAPSGLPIYHDDAYSTIEAEAVTFDYDALPTEVQLKVLQCLVDVFVDEHERCLAEGKWDAGKASLLQNKWVGRERGLKELLKLSRVRIINFLCKLFLY